MKASDGCLTEESWERAWAPYDQATYRQALSYLRPGDVVFEIGAGDLRLARRMAAFVKRVYALELQPQVLQRGLSRAGLPANLHPVIGDARDWSFPTGVTAGVLLMRHCRHFERYANQLKAAGAQRLITNARWGLDVEQVDLLAARRPYASLEMGWYACWCGATGFKPGPAENWTEAENARLPAEVVDCPRCGLSAEWDAPSMGRPIDREKSFTTINQMRRERNG